MRSAGDVGNAGAHVVHVVSGVGALLAGTHLLATEGLAAGHDVKVVSGADLCRWAVHAGFDTHPVGGTQSDLIAVVRTADGDVPSERLFSDVWVRAALPGMLDVTQSWRPDVIVHEEEEYAALLVAGIVGIPVVTHSWNSPARAAAQRATAAGDSARCGPNTISAGPLAPPAICTSMPARRRCRNTTRSPTSRRDHGASRPVHAATGRRHPAPGRSRHDRPPT